jgi:hypothetical protein
MHALKIKRESILHWCKSYEQIDDKIIIFVISYRSLPQELRVARSAGEI